MPLVRIDACGDRPDPAEHLAAALRVLPQDAPVIVLVHGYKYAPGHPSRCPHTHILSLRPRARPRAKSWPRHLGFGRGDPDEGLCIAFGWDASGTLWRAHAEAARAGHALATLIASAGLASAHVVAHSLGARVALAAVPHLPEGALGTAILLAAAETRDAATAALASPAGRHARFVNVRTRENAAFDALFRAAIHPHRPFARALGAGLGRPHPRWIDLRIDDAATRAHLAARGFRIPPPARAICHWSAYLRPGLFPLYRALLREDLPLAVLRPEETPHAAAAAQSGAMIPA